MQHGLGLDGFNPDGQQEAALAFGINVNADEQRIPTNRHRKGQLILALTGAITSEVENARWMVPPHHAVWLPCMVAHSNHATPGAHLYFLFIEPGRVEMPETCCTLKISSLVLELIITLAARNHRERQDPATQRLVPVLLDELPRQPQMQLQLTISAHPKIRQMVESMEHAPEQRQTLTEWAQIFAMSERNLARLVVKETGLSFRRWRQQLQLILAVRLLISGHAVQHIAQTLGYDSTTAFITMFKKGLGQTPGRYLAALGAG